jgi:hypothetical protein
MDKFMVFDVESVGLHGEGFAFGYVVVTIDNHTLESGAASCDPKFAHGTDADRQWVADNIPAIGGSDYPSPIHLRAAFWERWRYWAQHGAVLVADCAWPVEARFLASAIDDNPKFREREGPYPLYDLASVLLALGADALATTERLPDELPAHHPLMDARQSARQLVQCLRSRNQKCNVPT